MSFPSSPTATHSQAHEFAGLINKARLEPPQVLIRAKVGFVWRKACTLVSASRTIWVRPLCSPWVSLWAAPSCTMKSFLSWSLSSSGQSRRPRFARRSRDLPLSTRPTTFRTTFAFLRCLSGPLQSGRLPHTARIFSFLLTIYYALNSDKSNGVTNNSQLAIWRTRFKGRHKILFRNSGPTSVKIRVHRLRPYFLNVKCTTIKLKEELLGATTLGLVLDPGVVQKRLVDRPTFCVAGTPDLLEVTIPGFSGPSLGVLSLLIFALLLAEEHDQNRDR